MTLPIMVAQQTLREEQQLITLPSPSLGKVCVCHRAGGKPLCRSSIGYFGGRSTWHGDCGEAHAAWLVAVEAGGMRLEIMLLRRWGGSRRSSPGRACYRPRSQKESKTTSAIVAANTRPAAITSSGDDPRFRIGQLLIERTADKGSASTRADDNARP
jgi:hypothetical protein